MHKNDKYLKIKRFEKESTTHQQIRRCAYRWLWDRGFRAFGSFVDIKPYGIIDIVAVKSNNITIIDIVESISEILDKSKRPKELKQEQQDVVEKIIEVSKNINTSSILNNPEIQSYLNIIEKYNDLLKDSNLYWRMIDGLHIANDHYCFHLPEHEPTQKIESWGYVRVGIGTKKQDFKTYTLKKSESVIINNIKPLFNIEQRILRSVTTELYHSLPQNILMDLHQTS